MLRWLMMIQSSYIRVKFALIPLTCVSSTGEKDDQIEFLLWKFCEQSQSNTQVYGTSSQSHRAGIGRVELPQTQKMTETAEGTPALTPTQKQLLRRILSWCSDNGEQ